jgi:hypothetical protein
MDLTEILFFKEKKTWPEYGKRKNVSLKQTLDCGINVSLKIKHQMKQAVQRNLEDCCRGKEYIKYFGSQKSFNLSY